MFEVLRYMKKNALVLRLPVFLEALKTLRNFNENDSLLREVNPHLSSFGNLPEEACSDDNPCTDSAIMTLLLCNCNYVAINLMLEDMILKKTKLRTDHILAIIQISTKKQHLRTALLAVQLSARMGQALEREVYLSLLGPLVRSRRFPDALNIIEEMREKGLFLGDYLFSALTLKLVQSGEPAMAAELLYRASFSFEWNIVTYTALIHAYLQSKEIERGLKVYALMREKGLSATKGTYKVLIDGLEMAGRKADAEYFRKERKKLLQSCHIEKMATPVEESLCDSLFAC